MAMTSFFESFNECSHLLIAVVAPRSDLKNDRRSCDASRAACGVASPGGRTTTVIVTAAPRASLPRQLEFHWDVAYR